MVPVFLWKRREARLVRLALWRELAPRLSALLFYDLKLMLRAGFNASKARFFMEGFARQRRT